MKLSLKNIGKIGTASVEINGITVIAGENNTGKSTVGRALFALFNSFYNIQEQIKAERIQNIERLIVRIGRNANIRVFRRFEVEKVAEDIVEHIDSYKDNLETVKDAVIKPLLRYDENIEKHVDDEDLNQLVLEIRDGLNVPDIDIFKSLLEKRLNAEFNNQVSNIFFSDVGEIVLSIKGEDIAATVAGNRVKDVAGKIDLHTETIYIDDPFVLDEVQYFGMNDNVWEHREHLRMKLGKENNANLIEEIIANNKLESIYSKISTVCSGDIVQNRHYSLGYQRKNSDKILDVRNLSTGFKTFAILKTLLLNGTIEYNGTIILDEPEIHLHPEWQLLFAELIVLLHEKFGIHILLNTHSPYFLNAIEVYAAKYGVDDKCKYYLASSQDDIAMPEDVTNNIEKIYSKLAKPLQELENERGVYARVRFLPYFC